MENKNLNYRYPGVRYFTKDNKNIFCGREEDSKKLYTKIMLNKTLVLHAESGIGKSSLIQAGFLPLLEANQAEFQNQPNYLPITVRLDFLKNTNNQNTNVEILITETINKIKQAVTDLDSINIPYVNNKKKTLWLIGKKLSKKNLKLLLIFDQFEELQNFTNNNIFFFKKELCELLSNEIPKDNYDEIKKGTANILSKELKEDDEREKLNENIIFLEQSLDAKAIFVVREDKLGTMSLLSDYFPDILKNDFILGPLSKSNAELALTLPAAIQGDFISPNFTFEPGLITDLVEEISDNQTGLVDPIQIQIVATTIERNILKKIEEAKENNQFDDNQKFIVTSKDIPPITHIIEVFYENCWATIKEKKIISDFDFESAKNDIINLLVVNNRRDLVNSAWIIKNETKETDEKIVEELLLTGLIREVPFEANNKFYQLCHDRFIKPISEEILKFEEKKKTDEIEIKFKEQIKIADDYKKSNTIRSVIAVVFVITTFAASYFGITLEKERRDRLDTNKGLANQILVLNEISRSGNYKTASELQIEKLYLTMMKSIMEENKTDSVYIKITNELKKVNQKLKENKNKNETIYTPNAIAP